MSVKNLLVLTRQFRDIDNELIGDGVRIVRVSDTLRKETLERNHKQIAEWDLLHGGYDHALVNVYDPREKSDNEAEQEIVRASVSPSWFARCTCGPALEPQRCFCGINGLQSAWKNPFRTNGFLNLWPPVTAASRIRIWLPSEWECRGRHLSKA